MQHEILKYRRFNNLINFLPHQRYSMEPDEEPKLSLDRYIASHKELLLDPKEYLMVIDELLPLLDRDSIEHILRTKPETYSREELYQVYQADQYLIEHADLAARWFRTKPPTQKKYTQGLMVVAFPFGCRWVITPGSTSGV